MINLYERGVYEAVFILMLKESLSDDESYYKGESAYMNYYSSAESIKRNKKRWIVGLAGIFFVALFAYTANYIYGSLDYKKSLLSKQKGNQQQNPGTAVEEESDYRSDIGAATSVVTIIFLGIDRTEDRESWLGVYRTDTIAVARMNLDNKKIKVLSIPRDTYAYVPVEGRFDKINHAYAYGSIEGDGVQASIDAVNHFLGQEVVDHYFLMDMEPIPAIVDQIGGVELDVEIDMKDHGADLSKGLQVLNGQQVYTYIHWRYSPGGDIDRIKRQQKFISTLYKQQRDAGKIMDTFQIVLNYKNNIQTDLSARQMIGLANYMKDLPDGSVTYYTIPGEGNTINGISYWAPDEAGTDEVLKEFFQ